MKRVLPLLLAMALLLAGCKHRGDPLPDQTPEPPETEEPAEKQAVTEETPLELDGLRIEVSRSGLSSDRLMEAAQKLPELLRSALAENHIHTNTVQVTIGSSPAATVQALNEGTVDIAILPAEGFAGQETEAAVLLASGPGGESAPIWSDCTVGFQTAICTAATDYGTNLASRVGKEDGLPAWAEISRARWGLLEQDSVPGRRAVDLWLADNYEGQTTADLPNVTVYGDFAQLLQAAEAGEIDVFPMDASAEGAGAERDMPFPLGVTSRFYDAVVVVSPKREDLSDPELSLRDPLMFTLTQLCWYDGTQTLPDGTPAFPGDGYGRETLALCRDVFGAHRYGWAEDRDLAPARRLAALEGHMAE